MHFSLTQELELKLWASSHDPVADDVDSAAGSLMSQARAEQLAASLQGHLEAFADEMQDFMIQVAAALNPLLLQTRIWARRPDMVSLAIAQPNQRNKNVQLF